MRLGEADGARSAVTRVIRRKADCLAAAAEIALLDRTLEDEAFEAREAGRKRQLAGRLFLHVGFENDPVGRTAVDLRDLEVLLEIAQRVDPVGRALDRQRVERVPFGDAEFAAHHLILRQRVPVDVDPLDVSARGLADDEVHAHRQVFGIAVELRFHVGEGIAESAGRLGQAVDRIFDQLGVVPVAGLHRQASRHRLAVEVADLALHLHVAELVALSFLHHVSDDEVLLVRRQLGHGGNHAEIGIALRQVELPQLLLVVSHAIGIVAGAAAEYLGEAGLLRQHLALELAVGELLVADDVDRADLRLRPFGDLEHDIDAVLAELHHLRLDGRGEAALALVQLDDPGDVGADLGTGEYLPRGELDLLGDLVVLDALVAFEDDTVDHRIFGHRDDHVAVVVLDPRVGEQLGRGEILERLVSGNRRVGLTDAQVDIAEDRLRFEPLRADHGDRTDHLFGRRGSGRRCGLRGRRLRGCWRRRILGQRGGGNSGEHAARQQSHGEVRNCDRLGPTAHSTRPFVRHCEIPCRGSSGASPVRAGTDPAAAR